MDGASESVTAAGTVRTGKGLEVVPRTDDGGGGSDGVLGLDTWKAL